MPRASELALVHSLVALLMTAQPGQADDACIGAPANATHRLETSLSLPIGTTRPVVELSEPQSSSDAPLTVILEGIILPSRESELARTTLDTVVSDLKDSPVALVQTSADPDRHGRLRGVIQLSDGSNLQERLLAAGAGLADVSFTPCATRFLAAEARGREEKRGIWQRSRIWTDLNKPATGLPDFVLGRGKVASVGRSGHTTYINFGGNFRTDATVRLRGAVASALTANGWPPESLTGRVIVVRGWASRRNGLDIELESPQGLQLQDRVANAGSN